MKPIMLVGVVLLVLGIAGLAVGRFSFTTKEKVLDLGPIEATADEKHTVAIPDIAAGVSLVAGIILIIAGSRKLS